MFLTLFCAYSPPIGILSTKVAIRMINGGKRNSKIPKGQTETVKSEDRQDHELIKGWVEYKQNLRE